MKYLHSKDIAKQWNVSERSVRNYCSAGRVPGSRLHGKTWFIPEDAIKPTRSKRTTFSRKNLLQLFEKEKETNTKDGLYEKFAIEFTFHNNKIDGCELKRDQVKSIFETGIIKTSKKGVKAEDVLETICTFKCIDYLIENARKKLSETMVIQLSFLLMQNIEDLDINNLNLESLINSYNLKETKSIEDIIDFLYNFEEIKPFKSGNGKLARLIMLKECLKYNIVPILIKDEIKQYYLRGLYEYKNQKGFLIGACLYGQDIVRGYLGIK